MSLNDVWLRRQLSSSFRVCLLYMKYIMMKQLSSTQLTEPTIVWQTWLLEEQCEGFIVGVGPNPLGPLWEGLPLCGGVHVQVHAGHVV